MNWIEKEMGNSHMGDKRLDERAAQIVTRLAETQGSSLSERFRTRAELIAAYRFFDNGFVTPEKILRSHKNSLLKRIENQSVVLMLQDSTSLDFTGKSAVEGLGILEKPTTRGLLIHPTLAITPNRVCLGVFDLGIWSRDPEAKRTSLSSAVRKNEHISEKESYRWLSSYQKVNELSKQFPSTQFISIGDRESDILELIVEAVQAKNEQGADVIFRVRHDRSLPVDDQDPKGARQLKKKIAAASILGHVEFTIPSREKKPARKVTQTIRACEVLLNGKKVGEHLYPSVRINVVCAIEENPPEGEKPIVWIFFTTLAIDTMEKGHLVVKYYLCRWEIETFFNVLKTGCKVEERELKTAERISNMVALFMLVAWRVMYVMTMGRRNPEILSTELFEESEWKSVYKILNQGKPCPSQPPSLGDFMMQVARLGGYLEGKNRPPPGAKVIWRGLKRVSDFALAWSSFGS